MRIVAIASLRLGASLAMWKRRSAIASWGVTCFCCGMDFKAVYGDVGDGFKDEKDGKNSFIFGSPTMQALMAVMFIFFVRFNRL